VYNIILGPQDGSNGIWEQRELKFVVMLMLLAVSGVIKLFVSEKNVLYITIMIIIIQ
jgi:hypothetical protein